MTVELVDILIVGAGHAGAQAAVSLRMRGFQGSLVIIGEEPELPYERPALSKDYLTGEKSFERMLIRPVSFWAERQVTMLIGLCVTAIDPVGKVVFAGTRRFGYGQLIWATGGTPRRLECEGADMSGIFTVRTRADADAMVAAMPRVADVLVVGGGYIGLEAAAVFRKYGKTVTLLEALPRVLARVAGEPLSRFYEAEHRAHGVDVRLGAALAKFLGHDGDVTGAQLADGTRIAAQLVVVGIGIVPNVEPLVVAGAKGVNGVDVDCFCRTSLPDVFAIGDCAAHKNAFAGDRHIRLESVQNANDQATTVAKAILGDLQPYQATPWFWSNQYDLKLQTVGLSSDHDDYVLRGDPTQRSFSVIYLKDSQVVALDCVNATKDYVQGRKLVEAGASPARDRLADVSIELKELMA